MLTWAIVVGLGLILTVIGTVGLVRWRRTPADPSTPEQEQIDWRAHQILRGQLWGVFLLAGGSLLLIALVRGVP